MNLRIRIGRWISGDQKRINSYLSNIALLQDQLSKAKDDLLKANEQFDEIAHSVQISANQEAEIEKLVSCILRMASFRPLGSTLGANLT